MNIKTALLTVVLLSPGWGMAECKSTPRRPSDLRDAVNDQSAAAIDSLPVSGGSPVAPPAPAAPQAENGNNNGSGAAPARGLPQLPACASPLMSRIFKAASRVTGKGTVGADLLAAENNSADPEVLIEGPAIFAGVADMIEGARQEVNFQTYVWENDSEAAAIILNGIKRLETRRKAEAAPGARPVVVHILFDACKIGFGTKPLKKAVPLVEASLKKLALDPAYVRVEVAGFTHTLFNILHSKSLTVDGRRAIVMGANVEKVHNAGEPWFDAGYRFEGDIAALLREDFADAWKHGKHMRNDDDTARNQPLGPVPQDTADQKSAVCRPMLLVSKQPRHDPLSNDSGNPADQAFLGAFNAAARVIRIQTPGLNDDAFRGALLDAMVRRGVEVELIVSKGFNDKSENRPGQGGDNKKIIARLYKALREGGVADPCSRLKARWYSHDGKQPVFGNGPRASHAKYASIDDAVVIVGSSNMDTQSWNFSRELNVVVDDAEITAAWDRQVFLADFSRAITVDECRGQAGVTP